MSASLTDFYFNRADLRWFGSARRFEVKIEGLFQIGESFFFRFTLAGNVDFEAL